MSPPLIRYSLKCYGDAVGWHEAMEGASEAMGNASSPVRCAARYWRLELLSSGEDTPFSPYVAPRFPHMSEMNSLFSLSKAAAPKAAAVKAAAVKTAAVETRLRGFQRRFVFSPTHRFLSSQKANTRILPISHRCLFLAVFVR